MGEASLSGNMPGDVLHIGDSHRERSETIFPRAIEAFRRSGQEKFVISVFGGSGVGKSEVGYLLAERFRGEGLPAFLVSGDNYPYRIPAENDRERESRYRYHGLLALARRSDFHQRWTNQLRAPVGARGGQCPGITKHLSLPGDISGGGTKGVGGVSGNRRGN
jgi:hypothetical protein